MTRTESTTGTTRSRVTATSFGEGRATAEPKFSRLMCTPVLGNHCPALVVAPPASDLQVPGREPFATKAQATNKRARGFIVRLDVRFHAMKMQRPEDPAQRQRKALGHVSVARMRNECVVAEVGTLKGPAHDLADVDHASQIPRRPENDEPPFVGRLPEAPDVRTVRGRRAGRRRPSVQERPAASRGLQEPRFIARRWSRQLNSHLRPSASSEGLCRLPCCSRHGRRCALCSLARLAASDRTRTSPDLTRT